MEELQQILDKILEIYNTEMTNNEKHQILSELWTAYYNLSSKLNIQLEDAYRLYLIGENESYCLDQKPINKEIDLNTLMASVNHLKEKLASNN